MFENGMRSERVAGALDALLGLLTSEDDPCLWEAAVHEILGEIDSRWPGTWPGVRRIRVGFYKLRKWRRPHQTRWTGGGGFAYPESYGCHAHQQADWGAWFSRDRDTDWTFTAEREPTRKRRGEFVLRVCVPARTDRHDQAALNAAWYPRSPWHREDEKARRLALYGFRRSATGRWELTAHWESASRK